MYARFQDYGKIIKVLAKLDDFLITQRNPTWLRLTSHFVS